MAMDDNNGVPTYQVCGVAYKSLYACEKGTFVVKTFGTPFTISGHLLLCHGMCANVGNVGYSISSYLRIWNIPTLSNKNKNTHTIHIDQTNVNVFFRRAQRVAFKQRNIRIYIYTSIYY